MTRKAVITGMGCISGLGAGVAETWRRLAGGEGAIRMLHREAPEDKPARAMRGPAAWLRPPLLRGGTRRHLTAAFSRRH